MTRLASHEAATAALDDLITELTVCIDGLQRALRRAEQLRAQATPVTRGC